MKRLSLTKGQKVAALVSSENNSSGSGYTSRGRGGNKTDVVVVLELDWQLEAVMFYEESLPISLIEKTTAVERTS